MDKQDSDVSIHIASGCLLVEVPDHLDEDGLERAGQAILNRVAKTGSRRVVLNVSGVSLFSSYGFSILKNTARALGMMGAKTVFVGFRPGVAAVLASYDESLNNILTAVTLEDAFALFDAMEEENGETL